MPTRKLFPFDESGHSAEVPCNYCRVFKAGNLELCKHCSIYERRLGNISDWLKVEKATGVGNTLPVLNLAIEQLVSLFRLQGLKSDQINTLITKLVQDALNDLSKK